MGLQRPATTNEHPLGARGTLAERRKIGAYYTPQTVTDILSEWAIRSAKDVVLEPGFGGCGFLESSANRLKALGCTEPGAQLHGCDIDDHAFHILYSRLGLTQLSGHFVLGDFLSLKREAFDGRVFDVAIGNPPYIRHHHIVGEQKLLVRSLRDRMLPSLNLQASLWVYFLLHACDFLKVGGRAAWILPSSFAHTYYAKALRTFLRASFSEVRVIALDERLFETEGAAERTVVVVAEGWKQVPTERGVNAEIVRARSVKELRVLLSETEDIKHPGRNSQSAFEKLLAKARPLRNFCKLSIGVVTGDAAFFLFDREKAESNKLQDRDLSLIVSRTKLVPGLSVSTKDLKIAFEEGAPSKILDARGRQSAAMKRYLKSMSRKRIKANLTFGKRQAWHSPLDDAKSDAFFTGMSHHGPRLILNRAKGATCTNTLYRAAFYPSVTATGRRALSLALISSFGQLSAEYHGRCYGAGMLKHEPSEAEAIQLVLPTSARADVVRSAFKRVDALMRAGDPAAARFEADRFLVSTGTMSASQCRSIRTALKRARAQRWQHRAEK
jgi:adenine-specific DNA-methyltransferase